MNCHAELHEDECVTCGAPPTVTYVDAETFQWLLDELERPPKPMPRLAALLARNATA